MVEYSYTPEHLQYISEAALGLYALAMAYSAKQREWFKDRDDYTCQAHKLGIPHKCNGHPDMPKDKRRLQCHHVIPQRYAHAIGIANADFPENGIMLCESFHQKEIHPDMKTALLQYRGGDKEAFRNVGVNRDEMISRGAIYWNDSHDRRLSTRAIQLTQRFNKPFPER